MYNSTPTFGCVDCAGTPAGLGIAPVIIAEAVSLVVPAAEKLFRSIFGTGPKPGNEKIISVWANQVLQDPVAAALAPVYGGGPTVPAENPADAWLWLRCWAGDHSVDKLYTSVNPGDTSTAEVGCIGSDVAPQASVLVQQILAQFPALAGTPGSDLSSQGSSRSASDQASGTPNSGTPKSGTPNDSSGLFGGLSPTALAVGGGLLMAVLLLSRRR